MTTSRLALGIALALSAAQPALAQTPDPTHLIVAQDSRLFTLSVPVSKLMMRIPKGKLHLVPAQPNASPRYFFFSDSTRGLQISGWFEPADGFKDVKTTWKGDTDNWRRQGLPSPADVSFAKFGNWDGVLYDMPVRSGHDVNIRAHWVEAGTWIDIHLSMTGTGTSADLRARLKAVLDGIAVVQKPQ